MYTAKINKEHLKVLDKESLKCDDESESLVNDTEPDEHE